MYKKISILVINALLVMSINNVFSQGLTGADYKRVNDAARNAEKIK